MSGSCVRLLSTFACECDLDSCHFDVDQVLSMDQSFRRSGMGVLHIGVGVGAGHAAVGVIYISFIVSVQYIGYLIPYRDKVQVDN